MQSRTPVTFIDFSFVLPSFAALFKKDFNLVKNKQKNPPAQRKTTTNQQPHTVDMIELYTVDKQMFWFSANPY